MGKSAKSFSTRGSRIRGFSMVELAVSLAVIMILCAVALPSLTRAYRIYQLNDSATRLAGMLRLTRFEAIRRNKNVNCQVLQNGANWVVWADSDGDGVIDPSESQYMVTGTVTLEPDGSHPAPGAIGAALGTNNLTTVPGANNTIPFNSRGGVALNAGQQTVFVFYFGDSANAAYGFRAVTLLPSGLVQIWTAPDGANWQQVS